MRAGEQVVAVVADRDREFFQLCEGHDPVFLLAGRVFLHLVVVESLGEKGRIGTENNLVVLVFRLGIDADQQGVDITRQVGGVAEGEDVFAAGLDLGQRVFHLDLLARRMRAAEHPCQRSRTCGQGVIARAFVREFERRNRTRFGFRLVEFVRTGYPYEVARIEILDDRSVEFDFDDGVRDLANYLRIGRFAGFDGECLLAFVEAFREIRGDLFARLDRYAVSAGEQLQPFGNIVFRGVFAEQPALAVIDIHFLVLQRIVFAVGFRPRGRNCHRHHARAPVAGRSFVLRA